MIFQQTHIYFQIDKLLSSSNFLIFLFYFILFFFISKFYETWCFCLGAKKICRMLDLKFIHSQC